MGLHVCFEIVAPSKQFATSFDMALKVCVFLGSKLSGISRASYCARATALAMGARLHSLLTFRASSVGRDRQGGDGGEVLNIVVFKFRPAHRGRVVVERCLETPWVRAGRGDKNTVELRRAH